MTAVANGEVLYKLFYFKPVNYKKRKVSPISYALQKKILEKFISSSPHPHPIEYFTVKFKQEMDLAPIIATNLLRNKFHP